MTEDNLTWSMESFTWNLTYSQLSGNDTFEFIGNALVNRMVSDNDTGMCLHHLCHVYKDNACMIHNIYLSRCTLKYVVVTQPHPHIFYIRIKLAKL